MTVKQLKEWLAQHPEGMDDCEVIVRLGGCRPSPLNFGIFTCSHNKLQKMQLLLHANKPEGK